MTCITMCNKNNEEWISQILIHRVALFSPHLWSFEHVFFFPSALLWTRLFLLQDSRAPELTDCRGQIEKKQPRGSELVGAESNLSSHRYLVCTMFVSGELDANIFKLEIHKRPRPPTFLRIKIHEIYSPSRQHLAWAQQPSGWGVHIIVWYISASSLLTATAEQVPTQTHHCWWGCLLGSCSFCSQVLPARTWHLKR